MIDASERSRAAVALSESAQATGGDGKLPVKGAPDL
jgi:hypothetical protein